MEFTQNVLHTCPVEYKKFRRPGANAVKAMRSIRSCFRQNLLLYWIRCIWQQTLLSWVHLSEKNTNASNICKFQKCVCNIKSLQFYGPVKETVKMHWLTHKYVLGITLFIIERTIMFGNSYNSAYITHLIVGSLA